MSQKQNRETNNLQESLLWLLRSIHLLPSVLTLWPKKWQKKAKILYLSQQGNQIFQPPHIVQAAINAAVDPKNHKYTQVNGLPELREAISYKTSTDSKFPTTPDNILVTNGGKQACFQALATILGPGMKYFYQHRHGLRIHK